MPCDMFVSTRILTYSGDWLSNWSVDSGSYQYMICTVNAERERGRENDYSEC